ncbi:hypothetical protein SAY86_015906 [Trapa natans]|uniref:Sialate O-acetylesterase domain-containing protein n=1 Tax=Trapa natans TaxID=22666 RepID=A0AAN7QVW9_TRANT|nr:hypothetical protein SAY86_015906 [Trapa natans]
MSLLSLLLLSVLLPGGGGGVTAAASPEDIFILAGQSNMAGRGGVEKGKWNKFVPRESRPNPTVLRLTAGLEWVLAEEPLHYDIDVANTCGVGPGMAFANEVMRRSHSIGVIGLVPCAVGGTKISQWAKGTVLYNQMVARARAAVKGGGTIRGVLWYQGESDTHDKWNPEAYKGNMEGLINNLRSDLNNPSLLIIQVALASGNGPFVRIVRAAQQGITLPNVKLVDAKGLDLKKDKLHLTTTSEVKLGIMMARLGYLN